MSSNAHKPPSAHDTSNEADGAADFFAELVEQRVKMLMTRAAPQQRRYKALQEWTGIPSDRWSAVALGRQRPTAEMLGAICRHFNELTLWLMTGRDDPRNKQWNLETFFARKELRLSAILEKQPGSELSLEEISVLSSSLQLAKSLQDAERLECKRSASEINRLIESAPEDPANRWIAETPAWLTPLKVMKGQGASSGQSHLDKEQAQKHKAVSAESMRDVPQRSPRKKKSTKPSDDPKN